jgi:hypothetical protein
VRPGEAGTIPRGPGAMQSLVFGGPMRSAQPGYDMPLPPPSYDTATGNEPKQKRHGPLRRWMERRQEKRRSKEVADTQHEDGSAAHASGQ